MTEDKKYKSTEQVTATATETTTTTAAAVEENHKPEFFK